MDNNIENLIKEAILLKKQVENLQEDLKTVVKQFNKVDLYYSGTKLKTKL